MNLDHVIVPDLGRGARLADEPNPVASVSQGRTEDRFFRFKVRGLGFLTVLS